MVPSAFADVTRSLRRCFRYNIFCSTFPAISSRLILWKVLATQEWHPWKNWVPFLTLGLRKRPIWGIYSLTLHPLLIKYNPWSVDVESRLGKVMFEISVIGFPLKGQRKVAWMRVNDTLWERRFIFSFLSAAFNRIYTGILYRDL